MDLSLKALKAYVSKGNQWDQATDLARRCYSAINEETRKYLLIMLMIGVCFFFETRIGYLTLAPLASAFLFIAIFMIASVAVCIFIPMGKYASQYGKTKESLERNLVPDESKKYFDVLKECDPIKISATPTNIVLVTLNFGIYFDSFSKALPHLLPHTS
jgi:hypothetical protein